MSLEQFKKQVLLLHSEQSTLDSLSSGFTDGYTVHCATSGSEALNTLGETQIDVIVTAQELPGMSGLEALREAKKRSPDTIGILLAGSAGDDLEAVVGDQEVFQIVRGNVTADSLRDLIDNATRQARLMTLAKSANDTSAAMDEPVTEHIVMETSENGSSIISDGTGTMPVLNPDKISASTNVGSAAVDVLVLTKDEEFLTTVRESARGMHNVRYANTLAQADESVRKHKVGVAVVDAAMLGDNVEKLTMHLRNASPRLVSIVAGRRDDGEMLMDLINRGKVYRFLLKPVSPGRARLAIEASVKHHLEAPDSAFKAAAKGAPSKPAAAKPQPQPKKPVQQPEKKAAKPEPAAKKEPKVTPISTSVDSESSQILPEIKVEPRPVPAAKDSSAPSPLDDGLTDAFGGDDSSFTETVTGLVKSVGKTFSKEKADKPASTLMPASDDTGGIDFLQPKFIGMGAGAVVVLAMLGWWIFSGSDDAPAIEEPVVSTPAVTEDAAQASDGAPAVREAEVDFDEPPAQAVDTGPDIGPLLEEARLAAAAGQIFNPPGSNAIELYMIAAEAAPGNADVAAELSAAIDQALSMAETSLLERRADDAAAALARVSLADPGNARLPFLNAQLSQIQLRGYIDQARVAIRESRFEDAAAALDAARALGVADVSEINAVADELQGALSDQQVDEVLAKANSRLEAGQLTSPSNDNARYYYELALSSDPQNAAARQGLIVVASKLVLQARAQIDNGDFPAADVLLADARRLDPSSADLADATAALTAARNRVEQERLAAERAAEERAAAERAAAERAAEERAAAERAAAERAAAEKAEAERQAALQAEAARQAAAEQAAAESEPPAQQVAAASSDQSQAEPVGPAFDPAATRRPLNTSPVPVSSLKRTRYVAPKYPRGAQRRNVQGYVDVIFTVTFDGSVTDLEIRDSEPGDTFVRSASNAVSNWEFEPIVENGIPVEKRAAVRMMFAIE